MFVPYDAVLYNHVHTFLVIFDDFPKKSLFCTSTIFISSTFSVLRPFSYLRPFLYFDHFHIFDLFCTSTHRFYLDQTFNSTFLLRPKLYFDLYVSTNKKSRFDKRLRYRKGRRYENGRSTEKVELMRTRINYCSTS